jgi:dTDP-4-dehydrorhamnose reductase
MNSKKNKLLIIGADSSLGKGLKERFLKEKIPFDCTSRRKKRKNLYFDLRVKKSFKNIAGEYNAAVIFTGISKAIDCHSKKANKINVELTKCLINTLHRHKIFFLFISTNQVFSRKKLTRKGERTNPTSEYGLQKVKIEQYIKKTNKNGAVLRLGKVMGCKNNFLGPFLRKLRNGLNVEASKNFYVAPVSLEISLDAISTIMKERIRGVYQISADSSISFFDLLRKASKVLKINKGKIIATQQPQKTSTPLVSDIKRLKLSKSGISINSCLKKLNQ